ncbi:MAG TPA: hypothetical protein VGR19_11995 [Allosphingosinicella sp.]|nr:hypothetical protein [Allosphingosinicella sp.]
MHPILIEAGIEALAGRQVTDVEEVYRLIGGESRPEAVPSDIRRGLCDLLRELGYRQRWVRGLDGGRTGFRWVRGPWPIDYGALRGREVETYTNFD